MERSRPTSLSEPLAVLAMAVAVLAAVAAVLAVPFVFSNDGPEHLYSAWQLSGGPRVEALPGGGTLEVHWPLTAVGYLAPAMVLGRFLDPFAAHAALLTCLVVAYGGAGWLLSRRAGLAVWGVPLLAASSLNYLFWFGFLNFLAGQALGLLVLAWAAGVPRWSAARVALLSGLLLATAWMHALAGLLTGLVLLAAAVATPSPARWRRVFWLGVASVPLFVLQLVVTLGSASLDMTGSTSPTWHLANMGRLTIGGPVWRWLPIVAAALIGAVWTAARGPSVQVRAAAAVAAALFPIGLALPYSLPGWEVFGPRFALFGLLLGLALVPAAASARANLLLLGAATVLSVAASAWAGALHRRAFEGCEAIWQAAQLDDAPGQVQFFAGARSCLDPTSAIDTPLLPGVSFTGHAGALVATGRKMVHLGFHGAPTIHTYTVQAPHVFAGRSLAPAHWTALARGFAAAAANPSAQPPGLVEGNAAEAAATAAGADSFVLFGDVGAFAPVFAFGFREEHRIGDLVVASFAPRPGAEPVLRIVTDGRPGVARIDYGWVPLSTPLASYRVELGPDGGALLLPRVPAKPFWVRVTPEGDLAQARCRGVNSDNLLVFHFSEAAYPMTCILTVPGPP